MILITCAGVVTNLVIWLLVNPPFVIVNWKQPQIILEFGSGKYVVVLWTIVVAVLQFLFKRLDGATLSSRRRQLILGFFLLLWIHVGPYLISVSYIIAALVHTDPVERKKLAALGIGFLMISWIFTLGIARAFLFKKEQTDQVQR